MPGSTIDLKSCALRGVRVQVPLRVQNQSEKQSESGVSPLIFLHSHSHTLSSLNQLPMKFDFQNLTVYEKAKTFHVACKHIIRNNKLDRYVNDQLGRASFSIPLNIAEGSGKFSKKDRKNYFTTARASLFECIAVLDILSDENDISKVEAERLMKDADELSRMLFAMIKNLS